MARDIKLHIANVRELLCAFAWRQDTRSMCSDATPQSHTMISSSQKCAKFHHREALCEDESFNERQLAALLASKVYYQLGEYNESMIFALSAGKLFNTDGPGEYEDTIIGKHHWSSLLVHPSTNHHLQHDVSRLT